MSIKEKINDEYKTALKSKDKNKISTYRLILSGIKDLDISNRSGPNKKETDDEDIKKLLKKMIKQRNESVEIYKKNKREDLLKIEQGEIDLLSTYLPKQLSEEETKKICSEIIKKVGAQNIKDMGKVMGELKKSYSDSIDFSKAGSMLKELLNKQ
ncbi:GatB/YqeY domain-containing protein [Candidatus Pelagibacter sp.]|nr:GatB/YqeY domain-containing protein [Candidatus Pelagibacter sp.]